MSFFILNIFKWLLTINFLFYAFLLSVSFTTWTIQKRMLSMESLYPLDHQVGLCIAGGGLSAACAATGAFFNGNLGDGPAKFESPVGILGCYMTHRIHGAGILMLTWLGYINGIHVTIYGSTMDPMGEYIRLKYCGWLLYVAIVY